jgi:hypothetical protein
VVSIGKFIRGVAKMVLVRNLAEFRSFILFLDKTYVTAEEKELYSNILVIREVIKDMVRERRQELKDGVTNK